MSARSEKIVAGLPRNILERGRGRGRSGSSCSWQMWCQEPTGLVVVMDLRPATVIGSSRSMTSATAHLTSARDAGDGCSEPLGRCVGRWAEPALTTARRDAAHAARPSTSVFCGDNIGKNPAQQLDEGVLVGRRQPCGQRIDRAEALRRDLVSELGAPLREAHDATAPIATGTPRCQPRLAESVDQSHHSGVRQAQYASQLVERGVIQEVTQRR